MGKVFSDTLFSCMFWFFLAVTGFLLLWELFDWLCRPEPEQHESESPTRRDEDSHEPDRWEELTEEEKEELRRWSR